MRITYHWTRTGLRADLHDGGRLARAALGLDPLLVASTATYCDLTACGGVVTVRRRHRDIGHLLEVRQVAAGLDQVTRIDVHLSCPHRPDEASDVWRVALGVWLTVRHPRDTKWGPGQGPIEEHWRAAQSVDWLTAPADEEAA